MAAHTSTARFKITSPELPGVEFLSYPDFQENALIACIAKKAVDEFIVDGCEAPLWDTLRRLCCWDDESIKAVIANPREVPPITYGWPKGYEPTPAPVDPTPAIAATVQGVVDSVLDALRGVTDRSEPVPA